MDVEHTIFKKIKKKIESLLEFRKNLKPLVLNIHHKNLYKFINKKNIVIHFYCCLFKGWPLA